MEDAGLQDDGSLVQGDTCTSTCPATSLGSHKRKERSSPFPSPMKHTQSPLPKVQRRGQTGTEQQSMQKGTCEHTLSRKHTTHFPNVSDKALTDFVLNVSERETLHELQSELNVHMLHKLATRNIPSHHIFLNLQDFLTATKPTRTEKSHVAYLQVMDAVADSKDTVVELLHKLREEFIVGMHCEHLVVEGDGKLYEMLKPLQFEYGEELRWVISYPGDWHMLRNYQKPLMKAYFDVGLKALARTSGYPVPANQSSSQFKRSDQFILEAWEAVYRLMLTQFVRNSPTLSDSILHRITGYLQSPHTENFRNDFNHHLQLIINEEAIHFFTEFKCFIQQRAQNDDT